jgi:hypothetical protein
MTITTLLFSDAVLVCLSMAVTWYLSVFGHGAEKARLNPSLMYFTGIVTPGRRTAANSVSHVFDETA